MSYENIIVQTRGKAGLTACFIDAEEAERTGRVARIIAADSFHSAFTLADQKQGMADFVEKRKPVFLDA